MIDMNKKIQKFSWICFVLYLLVVLNLILRLDMLFSTNYYPMRNISLIPFQTIRESLSTDPNYISFILLFDNILLFMPFGFFLGMVDTIQLPKKILFLFLFPCLLEIFQYILGTGITDIDDVLLNFLGGLMGLLIFIGLGKVVKKYVQFFILLFDIIILINTLIYLLLIILN